MTGKIASRNYNPGDLIYSEEAFAEVLPRELKDIICESCGQRSIFLKACKQCLCVKYCGKACQKNGWSSHKLECKYMKNLPEDSSADIVRLLGKIILKTKDKNWKDIKRRILGTDFTFDDVDSHYKDMTENPRLNLHYKELRVLTARYIGKENMPSDLDLIKIIGKMKFNTYVLSAKSISFYVGLSSFENECIPNANLGQGGTIVKVWANKKINKGVDKITIPSRMLLTSIRIFSEPEECPCKCTDCSLPYGESVLSRILDQERAYNIIKQTENLLKLASIFRRIDLLSNLREAADDLLKKQEGVLGNTNRLRLQLLTVRYLDIRDNVFEVVRPVMELEKHMRSAYGDYSLEMIPIYEFLAFVNAQMGNLSDAFRYCQKREALDYH